MRRKKAGNVSSMAFSVHFLCVINPYLWAYVSPIKGFGFASQTAKSENISKQLKDQHLKYMYYINIDNGYFILINIALYTLVIMDHSLSYCLLFIQQYIQRPKEGVYCINMLFSCLFQRDDFHILQMWYMHSMIRFASNTQYIVVYVAISHLHINKQLIVMCVPNQNKSPFFINTDSTTDVSQSSNIAHIQHTLLSLTLGVI